MIFRTVTGMEYAEGYIIPWYLGRCYYRPDSDMEILAPIPLNFLIGWGYEAWIRLRQGPEGFRRRIRQARTGGFRAGMRVGEQRAMQEVRLAIQTGNMDPIHDLITRVSSTRNTRP